MYERLFEWLIKYINKTLSRENNERLNYTYRAVQSSLVIGVLDIYGFEIFENNRYDFIVYFVIYFERSLARDIVLNNYASIIVMRNYNNYLLNLYLSKNKRNMKEKALPGNMYAFFPLFFVSNFPVRILLLD